MKTKEIKFKLKGKEHAYNLSTFETIAEAQALLGADLLNVINLGASVYAKARALGKDPFKPRKAKYTIDISKLDLKTIQQLKDMNVLPK